MNNETRKKALKIVAEIEMVNSMEQHRHPFTFFRGKLNKLKSLLSEEEGREVVKTYLTFAPCPECSAGLSIKQNYCIHCGVRLIWPSEEESTKIALLKASEGNVKDD